MKKREYYENIWTDFNSEKKMVLISGPRQVGKTTLAKNIASKAGNSCYFNYDIPKTKLFLFKTQHFLKKQIEKKKKIR